MALWNMQAVAQYTLDGKKVATYPNIQDAAKATGINKTGIWNTCHGMYMQSGGYRFEFVEKKKPEYTSGHRYDRFMRDIDEGLTDEELFEKYSCEGFTMKCVKAYRRVHDGKYSMGSADGISWRESVRSLGRNWRLLT